MFTPVKQPSDGRELDVNTRTYNALLRGLRCAVTRALRQMGAVGTNAAI